MREVWPQKLGQRTKSLLFCAYLYCVVMRINLIYIFICEEVFELLFMHFKQYDCLARNIPVIAVVLVRLCCCSFHFVFN